MSDGSLVPPGNDADGSRAQSTGPGSTLEEGRHESRSPTFQETATPRPMEYRDLPKVVDTIMRSIARDPLNQYMYYNTPDGHKYRARWQVGRNVKFLVQYFYAIYSGVAWTINHGESIMLLADPALEERPLKRLLSPLVRWVARSIDWFCLSEEQRKRTAELKAGMSGILDKFLGEDMSHIIEIEHLATAPECQHRGYATALVQLAATLADARGARLELMSSNPANRHFYQSLGLKFLHTFYIGAENTSWAGAPVSIDLMIRDPEDKTAVDSTNPL